MALVRTALILGSLSTLLLASCASPLTSPPGYLNPVLDHDFPDPAVLQDDDGWFYAYATQTWREGRMMNLQVARSRDLVTWEHLGDALPVKPAWAERTQNFWAPHVVHDPQRSRYVMYYSAEPDGRPGKCLAVATSRHVAGPFTDSGKPMLCGKGFEHIDPMAFDDPQSGMRLLYWGSGRQPIRVQPLADDWLSFASGTRPVDALEPQPEKPHGALIEGAWVAYRAPFYYLYHSGGRCCGLQADYALRVARATSPLGPFELLPEEDGIILARNGFWQAPGHNSVVTDDEGADWLLYHAIDAGRAYFDDRPRGRVPGRVMLLDPISYRDGWPRVGSGSPSVGRQAPPRLGSRAPR